MTVRCPRCGTTYRHSARRLPAGSTFRCARCRHVFDASPAEPTLRDQEPTLDEREDEFVDEPSLPERRGARRPVDRDDDEPAFTFGDDDDEEPPVPVKKPAAPAPEPPARGTTPARFAVRALLIITLGYAVLSIYLYTHPDSLRNAFGSVPFLGPGLVETRVNPTSVQLADVRGTYQRVKGDHLVFVIDATAINNARFPLRGIQVEGRTIGAKEERQAVFCGAARRDVRDLSLREIALLQALEPPKDWVLAPGEQATCLIVFTDPAPDLREFAAEVVAVQAPPRHGRDSEGGP